jgi:hypothetical protein
MIEQLLSLMPLVMPALLGVYALVFTAGGVYYLEQRVSRIRDQFPERGPLVKLVGIAALSIGILAALSVAGHLVYHGTEFRWAALLATVAGVGFWITRIHVELTTAGRVRAALLAILCLALAITAGTWIDVE